MWLHLAVLIGMGVGIETLTSDSASLLLGLYAWMPLLAGVAVAIQPPDRRSVINGLSVAAISALAMIGLDIAGSFQEADRSDDAVYMEGEVRASQTEELVATASWVGIGAEWLRGDLQGADRRSESYGDDHPRLIAVEALIDFGLLFLCFATAGIVLGVCSWFSRHARFDSRANEAGARIAVSWVVAAGVLLVAQSRYATRRFDALFGAADLWTLLLPSFGFLAVGAVGFWIAARSDDRDPAGRS